MKKLFGVLIGVILAVMLIADVSFGSLNTLRSIHQAATEANQIDGYWTSSKPTTSVPLYYVNRYPTGVAYIFRIDSLLTAGTVTPHLIDIPLWKHWGVIGSYHIEVTDTAKAWATTNDSICIKFNFEVISGGGRSQTLLTVGDSAASGTTQLGGAAWVGSLNGEVDLSVEQYWWERLRLRVIQSSTAATRDTLGLEVMIVLPYSEAYRTSPYFEKNEVIK